MIHGMDTESVMALATRFADVAERVRAVEARLTSGLDATAWVGQDRERFESEWRALHAVALRLAADVLDDASHAAATQVREQEGASA